MRFLGEGDARPVGLWLMALSLSQVAAGLASLDTLSGAILEWYSPLSPIVTLALATGTPYFFWCFIFVLKFIKQLAKIFSI